AGLTAGAFAALIRDMSPRLSRALAFGLLTIGPVGANFLANFVAGATLPIYHTWESQIWIMGFFAIAMYFAIQGFGPLMFTEAFHYTPAEAAKMNEYFWLANLGALVLTGLVSDRLQTRKPIAIFGAVLASLLMAWWIPTFGRELPRATMAMVASLMGCFLAIGYVPWAAQFSETLEDVSPAL